MPDAPPTFPLPPARFTGASRKVAVMRAFDWIQEGWALFLGAPRVWLFLGGGIVLTFAIAEFLWLHVRTGFEPSLPRSLVLGLLFFGPVVLMPTATASGLHLCRLLARGETPELVDLVSGLKLAPQALLGAGGLYLAGWLIIFGFYEVIGGPLALFLPTLAGFAFLIAIWFIPPLVAFHQLSPIAALVKGFNACLRNAGVFAVFGFTMALLHLVAVLPAGLGLIVLLPVVIGALHASYRDVFSES
jgi:hypothetical protein